MRCAVQSAASRCGPALYVNASAAGSAWHIARTANTLLAPPPETRGARAVADFRNKMQDIEKRISAKNGNPHE